MLFVRAMLCNAASFMYRSVSCIFVQRLLYHTRCMMHDPRLYAAYTLLSRIRDDLQTAIVCYYIQPMNNNCILISIRQKSEGR
jgi:hypothetical protein